MLINLDLRGNLPVYLNEKQSQMNEFYQENFQQIAEKEHFSTKGVRYYFDQWCAINGEIVPKYVFPGKKESPKDWQKRRLREDCIQRTEGEIKVFVPFDIKLWEMIPIIYRLIETIYADDEVKAKKEKEKLKEVTGLFRNTAIYLRNYIDTIDWESFRQMAQKNKDRDRKRGRVNLEDQVDPEEFAKSFATDIYRISRWTNNKPNEREIKYSDIPIKNLSNEDKSTVDEWLLGTEQVEKRKKRLASWLGREPKPVDIDYERERLVAILFHAMRKEFFSDVDFEKLNEEVKPEETDQAWNEYVKAYLGTYDLTPEQEAERKALANPVLTQKPWEKPGPFFAVQSRIQEGYKKMVNMPLSQLELIVFQGSKKEVLSKLKESLVKKSWREDFDPQNTLSREDFLQLMRDFGVDVEDTRRRLSDQLKIKKLKSELNQLRESGASLDRIEKKELEIVDSLQAELSDYEYTNEGYSSLGLVTSQGLNCVGVTLVSSILFEEVGIKYFPVMLHGHSSLIVETATGNYFYRDMAASENNTQLSDQHLVGGTEKIAQFSSSSSQDVLQLSANKDWYEEIIYNFHYGKSFFNVFKPGVGVSSAVANNFFHDLGKVAENGKYSQDVHMELLEKHINEAGVDYYIADQLIFMYLDQGKTGDALALLYFMGRKFKDKTNYFYRWGELLSQLGFNNLAVESFRSELMQNCYHEYSWKGMTNALITEGRLDQALLTCDQVKRWITNHEWFCDKKIQILFGMERYEEAIEECEEMSLLVDEDPNLFARMYELKFMAEPQNKDAYFSYIQSLVADGLVDIVKEAVAEAQLQNPGESWPQEIADRLLGEVEGVGLEVQV